MSADVENATVPATAPDLPLTEPLTISPVAAPPGQQSMDAFMAIPIDIELVLSIVRMPVARLMETGPGSEIDLEHPAGGEVMLIANGSRFAFGELFLIDADKRRVGVRITRLAHPDMKAAG
ncbi:MAG: hypothetical protein HC779_06855 [Phyllobacteriaceae bacterium]|nr:hypothetical protein [Phyllobacteriaceae bacterium]